MFILLEKCCLTHFLSHFAGYDVKTAQVIFQYY